ncbi:MAG: ABC transporter permease [Candidatus Bathyarchaeia archaeon]
MARKWLQSLIKAFHIAKKDAKVYYFKAPNFTYGILMPVSLFIAFSIAGQINSSLIVSGLTSLVILFGTTSIEAVAIVLEKQTGTFERLLAAPVSFFTILLGKALAGLFFGLVLAAVILVPLSVMSGTFISNPMLVFIAIAFSSLTFSALGVLISAYAKWVPEAQMLSNFLRFPMAFLSGTFLPLEFLPSQLQTVARFLPLTYSVEALRISINAPAPTFTYLLDILLLALFSLVLLVVATKVLQRRLE